MYMYAPVIARYVIRCVQFPPRLMYLNLNGSVLLPFSTPLHPPCSAANSSKASRVTILRVLLGARSNCRFFPISLTQYGHRHKANPPPGRDSNNENTTGHCCYLILPESTKVPHLKPLHHPSRTTSKIYYFSSTWGRCFHENLYS